MKLKFPSSLQAWLFSVGAVLLLLVALLYGILSIVAAYAQAHAQSGMNLRVVATWSAFALPISILEFFGLSFLILAALASIFRSILPSKQR